MQIFWSVWDGIGWAVQNDPNFLSSYSLFHVQIMIISEYSPFSGNSVNAFFILNDHMQKPPIILL